jgi:hypothetical protein
MSRERERERERETERERQRERERAVISVSESYATFKKAFSMFFRLQVIITRCDICRIWSRNAENFSALFYVVKRVTKSQFSVVYRMWRFLHFFDNFLTFF